MDATYRSTLEYSPARSRLSLLWIWITIIPRGSIVRLHRYVVKIIIFLFFDIKDFHSRTLGFMCTEVRDYRIGDSWDFPYHGIWFIVLLRWVISMFNCGKVHAEASETHFPISNELDDISIENQHKTQRRMLCCNVRKTQVRHDEGLEIIAFFSFFTIHNWALRYLNCVFAPTTSSLCCCCVLSNYPNDKDRYLQKNRNNTAKKRKKNVDSIVSGFADCRQKDK